MAKHKIKPVIPDYVSTHALGGHLDQIWTNLAV
jgi:hypothetical protein